MAVEREERVMTPREKTRSLHRLIEMPIWIDTLQRKSLNVSAVEIPGSGCPHSPSTTAIATAALPVTRKCGTSVAMVHLLVPPPDHWLSQLQMVQSVAQPIILTHFEQSAPYRKYRHGFPGEPGRPSLDLEKMQQSLASSRPSPRYTYDPSIFAFRSLSTGPPCSVLTQPEDPSCS
ncbi:unnamed protein product [Tetraodon nigroviridis]|uniref:(spotted green pufferfish) hypothetical protein n=1 Tax=Tetraodon nigroviridis TaxID=99883 RepID=Q4RGM5_TETNG|nr:unnamed protein product [Tetraodon nigroviridis]